MFALSDLFVLAFVISVCAYWWQSQGIKQLALNATRQYCNKVDVQLLDESVALRRFWFKRDENGQMRVWRCWQFEFTATGNERYNGRILVLGRRIETIELDPHRLN